MRYASHVVPHNMRFLMKVERETDTGPNISDSANTMAETSSESKSIPEEIRKSVRAVLLSKIGGVPLERFSSDFKKLAGYPLPFKELGFSSVREVLDAMPDAVRFNYSDEASKWMLYGIGDPNSYMSSAAKKAQYSKPGDGIEDTNRKRNRRKSGKSKKNKGNGSPTKQQSNKEQTSEGDDITGERTPCSKGDNTSSKLNTDGKEQEIRVPKSNRGFHSVCVYYNGKLGDSRHKVMQEITELFATQGDVVEKSSTNSLMFFRFLTEEEAISVIKLYNGRCLSDGKTIRVSPASEKMPAKKNSNNRFEGKPSMNEQWEQQQHHLEHLQHQQILAQQQMAQPYYLPEAHQFMHVGNLGMHEDQFLGHPEHYGHEGDDVEICVFNIDQSITKEDLISHFWQFNPKNVRLRSKLVDGNKKRYFAFVAFACIADARNAEASMTGTFVRRCQIKMEIARTKAKERRSPEQRALLHQAKKLNNQKPRREQKDERRDQPPGCRSEDESNDSITAEIVMGDDPDNPPDIPVGDKVPVIDDSPYSSKTHSDDTLSSRDSEGSPVPGLQEGGMTFGRGRGSFLSGHVSPSVGRGLAMFNTEVEKKKLRPSLADLTDKIHEL